MISSHKDIIAEAKVDDVPILQLSCADEVLVMHDNWHRQIEALHYTQKGEFRTFILSLYDRVQLNTFIPNPVQATTEDSSNSTLHPDVKYLIDMGFSAERATTALKISNESVV